MLRVVGLCILGTDRSPANPRSRCVCNTRAHFSRGVAGKRRVRAAPLADLGLTSNRYRKNPELARPWRDAKRPLAGLRCRMSGKVRGWCRIGRAPCAAAATDRGAAFGAVCCSLSAIAETGPVSHWAVLRRQPRQAPGMGPTPPHKPCGVGAAGSRVRRQSPGRSAESARQLPTDPAPGARLPGCPDTPAALADTAVAPTGRPLGLQGPCLAFCGMGPNDGPLVPGA